MDPISLVTACIGTLAGVAQLTAQINSLTSGFADAKRDLGHVSRELVSIGVCLEALREAPFKDDLPASLLRKLVAVVTNCETVCSEIAALLKKLASGSMLQRLSWTFKQRERADRLRGSLEAHKSALDIALELGAITQLHELQVRTKSIKDDTVALRASLALVEQMAEQVQAMSLQVQRDQTMSSDPVVEAFLAEVAAYAEAIPAPTNEGQTNGPDRVSAASQEIARLNELVTLLREERDQLAASLAQKNEETDRYNGDLQDKLLTIFQRKSGRIEEARKSIERHNSQLRSCVGTIALAMTTDPQSELGIRRASVTMYNEMYEGMVEDLETELSFLRRMGGNLDYTDENSLRKVAKIEARLLR